MVTERSEKAQKAAQFALISGGFLCATGLVTGALCHYVSLPPVALWCGGASAGILTLMSVGLFWRTGQGWMQHHRIRRACRSISPLAEAQIPQLLGDYPPYIMEAAEKLGEARDVTAVPALLGVLDHWVDEQRPGWRDIAEAIVKALEQIGDRRALPLFYRLLNVRGIGILPAIRSAIAAIEPQTSLLRPGCAEEVAPEWLLRPVKNRSHEDETTLLRAEHGSESLHRRI